MEIPQSGPISYENVVTPVPGPLATITGELDGLLDDPIFGDHEGSWVRAIVTDPVRQERSWERLIHRFPHLKQIEFHPKGGLGSPVNSRALGPT